MRKIFLPPELYNGIKEMSFEDKWKLFDYVYMYNLWVDFVIDEHLKIVFWFFKPFFDGDIERHNKFLEVKRDNGKKWWRPKTEFKTTKTNNNLKKLNNLNNLPEVKWSDILNNIEEFQNLKNSWNDIPPIWLAKKSMPNIRKDTDELLEIRNTRRREYTVDEIKLWINNYIKHIVWLTIDPKWYYKHRFTLFEFLKQKNWLQTFINKW